MPVHKLLGDFNAMQSQVRNLMGTLGAAADRKRMFEWCTEYARRNGWGPPAIDVVAQCGPKSGWKGAPTALSAEKVLPSTTMSKQLSDTLALQICDAHLFTMKMTGIGLAKHPTWIGGSLCVASLVDQSAKNLPPFSAVCKSHLPAARQVLAIARLGTGLPLGKTDEHRIWPRDTAAIDDFDLYCSAPERIDTNMYRAIANALAGWSGHLRTQHGIFMSWQWRGDDPSHWSAEADRTLSVLQDVRDALLGINMGKATTASVAAAIESRNVHANMPRRTPSALTDTSTLRPNPVSLTSRPLRFMAKRAATESSQTSATLHTHDASTLRLPLGMSGQVIDWFVRPNQELTKGEPVVQVRCESADGEPVDIVLTSPVTGYTIRRRRAKGTELTSRSVVVRLDFGLH